MDWLLLLWAFIRGFEPFSLYIRDIVFVHIMLWYPPSSFRICSLFGSTHVCIYMRYILIICSNVVSTAIISFKEVVFTAIFIYINCNIKFWYIFPDITHVSLCIWICEYFYVFMYICLVGVWGIMFNDRLFCEFVNEE
jgi:hypothetical protein